MTTDLLYLILVTGVIFFGQCLNVSKTKDLSTNFKKESVQPCPAIIQNESVESADHFLYLGMVMDSKLKFSKHCDTIFKKGQQRLQFLRKLRSFNVDKTVPTLFFSCFVQSVLSFSVMCWWGNRSVSDKCKLQKLVNICSKITGQQ